MSSTMQEVCAIFEVNKLRHCGNVFIHELAMVGMGKWDLPFSCTYDMTIFKDSVDVATSVKPYGLDFGEDGSPWNHVYRDLVTHWNFYRSNEKPNIGVLGDEQLLNVLRSLKIECVDLTKLRDWTLLYDDEGPYKKFACGRHSQSEKGCAASRVAYYKDWLIKNVE